MILNCNSLHEFSCPSLALSRRPVYPRHECTSQQLTDSISANKQGLGTRASRLILGTRPLLLEINNYYFILIIIIVQYQSTIAAPRRCTSLWGSGYTSYNFVFISNSWLCSHKSKQIIYVDCRHKLPYEWIKHVELAVTASQTNIHGKSSLFQNYIMWRMLQT